MSIIDEFFSLLTKYKEKYGEKTILFMQVGSFYETFEYIPEHDSSPNLQYPEAIGSVYELEKILVKCVSHVYKSTKDYSFTNPYSLGFPLYAYDDDDKKPIILAAGYTVVLYNQVGVEIDAATKRTRREVASVESKHVSLQSNDMTNIIVSIYIECMKPSSRYEDYILICGLSYLDILTGANGISEVYSVENNKINALHEIYRYLLTINPKEIIINLNKFPKDNKEKYKNMIYSTLELDNFPHVIYNDEGVSIDFCKASYHSEFLSRLFTSENNKFIIQELGLERMDYGRTSYIYLIQGGYEHNRQIIQSLKRPVVNWINQNDNLILTHNAIKQLDLQSNNTHKKKIDSLITLMDKTHTSMGHKLLISRILNPLTDIKELNKNYDMISDVIKNQGNIPELVRYIGNISDIEKLHRKIYLGSLTPKEFVQLIKSYKYIETIYEIIDKSDMESLKTLIDRDKLLQMSRFNSYIFSNINLDVFQKCKIGVFSTYQGRDGVDSDKKVKKEKGKDKCIILDWMLDLSLSITQTKDDYYYPIQVLEYQIKWYKNELLKICEYLNQFTNITSGPKVDIERKTYKNVGFNEELFIYTSTAKGNNIKKSYDQGMVDPNLVGNLTLIKQGSGYRIDSNIINSHISNLMNSIKNLYSKIWNVYQSILLGMASYTFFDYITDFISQVDFIISNANVAIKYNYNKPEIIEGKSYFDMKELRHPIAEQIIDQEYITNDISLGLGSELNYNSNIKEFSSYGLLLYGTNSAGKSTLAKAIGLNIILAQAGCYTACKLKYSPYKKIITRLSGNDDLLKGMSSFVIEMMELGTILRNADESTLIIGDELCRGTEIESAESLSVASIQELVNRKSSFIFSTHFHDLVNYDGILKLSRVELNISHLAIHYMDDTDKLIYDRKLQEGSGNSNYGIDIAKSLHLPSEFIKNVYNIRDSRRQYKKKNNNLNIIPTNKSNYNKNVYVDKCELCGSTENIHTHHMKEQHTADKNGFIGAIHKNNKSNLVGLCADCHTKLHSEGIELTRIQTIDGSILQQYDP